MPKYAQFDSTITGASPVIGYYDTDDFTYANLPSVANLHECTAAEWAERMTGQWAISNGAMVPYTPPVATPTLAQQAAAALNGSVIVTSTSTSGLNGTYPVNQSAQFLILSELQSLNVNGTFTDGTTTLQWDDVNGTPHGFSVAEFKAFATAVGAYCSPLYRIVAGTVGLTIPTNQLTIA